MQDTGKAACGEGAGQQSGAGAELRHVAGVEQVGGGDPREFAANAVLDGDPPGSAVGHPAGGGGGVKLLPGMAVGITAWSPGASETVTGVVRVCPVSRALTEKLLVSGAKGAAVRSARAFLPSPRLLTRSV
jgi:hypothetical protein